MLKFLILLLLSMSVSFADEVKVETNPARPVAGEVFQAYFRIFTETDEEPTINFSPRNLEVVGKANHGVSTRTIYANGKLTVTREVSIVYDLVAARPGYAYMNDVNVQVGSKTIRHPSVSITVLKEAEVSADVFLKVDVPKKEVFIGEGVVARYFLYRKVNLNSFDVKKYPKLNNFLKRFLQEPERPERVSVDGELYIRSLIYAAKLYPEKMGELKIDPLTVSVSYTSGGSDPFGSFGMNRDLKTKSINSETVKLIVKPLPEPIPAHFTGLVGQHDFQLNVGQSKLIVNEPLEIKLTVTGVGALENLEAPKLLDHESLEEFESNGDLKISDAETATKIFDYTFLAKENLQIPAKDIVLSYFDPNSMKYVSTSLKMPEIIAAGGQVSQNKNDPVPSETPKVKSPSASPMPTMKDLAGPISVETSEWKSWLPVMNFSLAAFAVLLSIGWIVKEKKISNFLPKGDVPSQFKKGEFELGDFVKWMTPVIKTTGKSPLAIIKESPLPEESKRYFIDLLTANDYKDYSIRKSQMEFKYQSSHFKELAKYIESAGNENSSQPS